MMQESIVQESCKHTISLQAYTTEHGKSWESVFYQVTFTSTSRCFLNLILYTHTYNQLQAAVSLTPCKAANLKQRD